MTLIPCAVQYILVPYPFIHSSLYLLIPYPYLALPHSLFLLITTNLFSIPSESVSMLRYIFVLFFRFHM